MAYLPSKGTGVRRQTTSAVLGLFILTIIGSLSINFFNHSVSLSFVPLIGVCLWPRHTKVIISVIFIFLWGLLLDLITSEALGFHTLTYLVVFAVLRPDLRLKRHKFGVASLQWLGIMLLSMFLVYILSVVGRRVRPDFLLILLQGIVATVVFPVIYLARNFSRALFSDLDDWY